jgi:hypothetical protein
VHTFINMDDPEHGLLRRMVTAFFTGHRTHACTPDGLLRRRTAVSTLCAS